MFYFNKMLLGHGWGAADEGHDGGYGDSPVSFEGGDHNSYSLDDTSGHEGY